MIPEYVYYGNYDQNAMTKVNLNQQIRDWLWTMGLLLDFIDARKPNILDSFVERLDARYSREVEGTPFVLNDVGFEEILEDQSILGAYVPIKDLGLQVVMKYIPLEKGNRISGPSDIKSIDHLRAKHMLLYHQIAALVDTLGRVAGIQFFKDFVEFWGEEVAKKGHWKVTLKQARQELVPYWENSNGFEFGIVDLDDEMFLAKFDRCVWYDSMSHIADKELAYYTVCYPGPMIGRHAHEEIMMRRSVTLFTGEFCDELRWNRHVHDEPEQPSIEFSKQIVQK